MPKQDAAAILGEILSEADALIRLRLKEQGLELPHLVVGATPDNQIVVRSNGDHEVMRSFGEDLKNVADELTAPTGAGRHDALIAPDLIRLWPARPLLPPAPRKQKRPLGQSKGPRLAF